MTIEDKVEITPKQVFGEIYKDVKEGTGKALRASYDFTKEMVLCGGEIALFPIYIPSYIRKYNNDELRYNKHQIKAHNNELTLSKTIGSIAGSILGMGGVIAQGFVYGAKDNWKEALAILATTNIASGLYELGRKHYHKTKDKLVAKHFEELKDKRDSERIIMSAFEFVNELRNKTPLGKDYIESMKESDGKIDITKFLK